MSLSKNQFAKFASATAAALGLPGGRLGHAGETIGASIARPKVKGALALGALGLAGALVFATPAAPASAYPGFSNPCGGCHTTAGVTVSVTQRAGTNVFDYTASGPVGNYGWAVFDSSNAKVAGDGVVSSNVSGLAGSFTLTSPVTTANAYTFYGAKNGATSGNVKFTYVAAAPTSTPVPPTNTPMPTATRTPLPPTATSVPPTATRTPMPPTATSVPPTATRTPMPPTATSVPPTATSVPPTATSVPPTATSIPPTGTPIVPASTPLPTDTPVPPTSTPIPPTATPITIPPVGTAVPQQRWEVEGMLQSIDGSTWTVNGVQFTVNSSTRIEGGSPSVGTTVEAEGTIDSAGQRIAQKIEVKQRSGGDGERGKGNKGGKPGPKDD